MFLVTGARGQSLLKCACARVRAHVCDVAWLWACCWATGIRAHLMNVHLDVFVY